jgi:ATP-dependent RNA helicase DDX27
MSNEIFNSEFSFDLNAANESSEYFTYRESKKNLLHELNQNNKKNVADNNIDEDEEFSGGDEDNKLVLGGGNGKRDHNDDDHEDLDDIEEDEDKRAATKKSKTELEAIKKRQDHVRIKSQSAKKLKVDENEFFELPSTEDMTKKSNAFTFEDMNISKPLIKALARMGLTTPTAIQTAGVPTALMGKDICACAVTGSGKTLAFMLPTVERLLYKPKFPQVTRVLVLTPTRELAVQICKVTRELTQFTNINTVLCCGGFDIKTQEAALRMGPDICIATPGRLIDHLQNTPCFNLEAVEILILDEADRMLDECFFEQLK